MKRSLFFMIDKTFRYSRYCSLNMGWRESLTRRWCLGTDMKDTRERVQEVGGQVQGWPWLTQRLWFYMGGGGGHKMCINFFNPSKQWARRSMEIREVKWLMPEVIHLAGDSWIWTQSHPHRASALLHGVSGRPLSLLQSNPLPPS